MKLILTLILLFFIQIYHSQMNVLYLGNTDEICDSLSNHHILKSKTLPKNLKAFDAIFIFSTANSYLTSGDIDSLENYLRTGKGIYIGAENWPMLEESNQLTSSWFRKNSWGNFNEEKAVVSVSNKFDWKDSIPAGESTVSFPVDYRLHVDAWVNDEPLIQSGELLEGRIIIDGGYSRFYCNGITEEKKEILIQMLDFLSVKD